MECRMAGVMTYEPEIGVRMLFQSSSLLRSLDYIDENDRLYGDLKLWRGEEDP